MFVLRDLRPTSLVRGKAIRICRARLSEAYLQGMNQLIECVRQVRGELTAQVEDVHLSFCDTGIGTGAVILERDA